jgi:hypothetical protein
MHARGDLAVIAAGTHLGEVPDDESAGERERGHPA